MLDMGIISEEEGLSQILTRLDTEEEKELARKSFAHWHEYNMYHKEGMEELVRELKEEGYRIYLCSCLLYTSGNSGGALLNMKGELVGINAAKYASTEVEGIGYARCV